MTLITGLRVIIIFLRCPVGRARGGVSRYEVATINNFALLLQRLIKTQLPSPALAATRGIIVICGTLDQLMWQAETHGINTAAAFFFCKVRSNIAEMLTCCKL